MNIKKAQPLEQFIAMALTVVLAYSSPTTARAQKMPEVMTDMLATVTNSPAQDAKMAWFREDACARHGLKLGVYYSQSVDWHESGGEGNSWDFGSDSKKDKDGAFDNYLQTKVEPQLKELLTNYGSICEMIKFGASDL